MNPLLNIPNVQQQKPEEHSASRPSDKPTKVKVDNRKRTTFRPRIHPRDKRNVTFF